MAQLVPPVTATSLMELPPPCWWASTAAWPSSSAACWPSCWATNAGELRPSSSSLSSSSPSSPSSSSSAVFFALLSLFCRKETSWETPPTSTEVRGSKGGPAESIELDQVTHSQTHTHGHTHTFRHTLIHTHTNYTLKRGHLTSRRLPLFRPQKDDSAPPPVMLMVQPETSTG